MNFKTLSILSIVIFTPVNGARVSLAFTRMVQVDRVTCDSDNLNAFQFEHCELQSDENGHRMLVVGNVLERPVTEAVVRVRICRKQQADYIPFLFDFPFNYCEFTSKNSLIPNKQYLQKLFRQTIQNNSNVGIPCPVYLQYPYLNFTLDEKFSGLSPIPAPYGQQRLDIEATLNGRTTVKVFIYHRRI